jgi:hypothetical protein
MMISNTFHSSSIIAHRPFARGGGSSERATAEFPRFGGSIDHEEEEEGGGGSFGTTNLDQTPPFDQEDSK